MLKPLMYGDQRVGHFSAMWAKRVNQGQPRQGLGMLKPPSSSPTLVLCSIDPAI
jgi:hypothetical protein